MKCFITNIIFFISLNTISGQINWMRTPHIEADTVYAFQNEMALFSLRGKLGYLDRYGSIVVAPFYESAMPFRNGLAVVGQKGRYGAIDKKGNLLVEINNTYLSHFEPVAIYSDNNISGIITKAGVKESPYIRGIYPILVNKHIIYMMRYAPGFTDLSVGKGTAKNYDLLCPYQNGYAPYFEKSLMGYADANLVSRIPNLYDKGYGISEEVALVSLNNKWYFLDLNGERISHTGYDAALPFKEGYAPVCIGERWTFIDKNGNEMSEFKYNKVYPFSEGLAAVVTNDRVGYVNTRFEEVIECKYEVVNDYTDLGPDFDFDSTYLLYSEGGVNYDLENDRAKEMALKDGMIKVNNFGKFGYLDRFGDEIVPIIYSEIGRFSEGLAAVKWRNKWGYVDQYGGVVIEPTFETAYPFRDGVAVVRYGARWGILKNPIQENDKIYEDYNSLKPQVSVEWQIDGAKNDKLALAEADNLVILKAKIKSNIYLGQNDVGIKNSFSINLGNNLQYIDSENGVHNYEFSQTKKVRRGESQFVLQVIKQRIILAESETLEITKAGIR